MQPQPMIAVRDVEATSRWYQDMLGLASGHGGPDYEQLLAGSEMVLQLHRWEPDKHPHMGDPDGARWGNGVVLWFLEPDVTLAFERARRRGATILEPLALNRNANHREFWLRDPDGYVVVVAGRRGDVG